MLPVVGPFFGEGHEDFVGVAYDHGHKRVTVVAVDGESFEVRWSSPAGADEHGRTTQLAVVGGRVP
jgi:hypothetical protein